MADSKKKDIGLAEIAGIFAATKAISDLDEIKKQTAIHAKEAKRQTEISERMLEEQRDSERSRNRQEERHAEKLIEIEEERTREEKARASREEKRIREKETEEQLRVEEVVYQVRLEKIQKFVNDAEGFGLTPFAGQVLFLYFDKYPLSIGINSAAHVLKNRSIKDGLFFLLMEKEKRRSLLDSYIKSFTVKYSVLSDDVVEECLKSILVECISNEETKFLSRLETAFEEASEIKTKEEEERKHEYDQALAIVTDRRNISSTTLSKSLSTGYNHSESLLEEMEKNGVVGPRKSTGQREVLTVSESFLRKEKEEEKAREEKLKKSIKDEIIIYKKRVSERKASCRNEVTETEKELIKIKNEVSSWRVLGVMMVGTMVACLMFLWSGENSNKMDVVILKVVISIVTLFFILMGSLLVVEKEKVGKKEEELKNKKIAHDMCDSPFLNELSEVQLDQFVEEMYLLEKSGKIGDAESSNLYEVYLVNFNRAA